MELQLKVFEVPGLVVNPFLRVWISRISHVLRPTPNWLIGFRNLHSLDFEFSADFRPFAGD